MHLQGSIKAGTIYIIIILVILFSLGFQLIGGAPRENPPIPTGTASVAIDPNTIKVNNSGQESLQLYTFEGTIVQQHAPQVQTNTTRSITQSNNATQTIPRKTIDIQKTGTISSGCRPPGVTGGNQPPCPTQAPPCTAAQDAQIEADVKSACHGEAGYKNTPGDCAHDHMQSGYKNMGCVGKPVIYLYPTKKILVTVSLQISGDIVQSIPTYPAGGWQNILAFPDGRLMYQGKEYSELYYEGAIMNIKPPSNGIVIQATNLQPELYRLTTRLGLFPSEQQEFLDYWLPRLHALKSPYILFSLIDPVEKHRIDHVDITPRPDTMIEFLAYFKPLQTSVAPVKPLVLPNPPVRHGFTAVEWGGTIDY